jgi:hypothetical protein
VKRSSIAWPASYTVSARGDEARRRASANAGQTGRVPPECGGSERLRGEKRRGEEGRSTVHEDKRRGEEGMTTVGDEKQTGEDDKRQILLASSTVHRALSLGDVGATQILEDERLCEEKT